MGQDDDLGLPPGLREDYLQSARDRLRDLAALADRLGVRGDDGDALEQLRHESHKIHGCAGAFGFYEASRLAAGMEVTVKDWLSRRGDTDVERGSVTRWFVARLAALLNLPVPAAMPAPPGPRASPPPPLRPRPPSPPSPPVSAAPLTAPELIYVEDDAALAELLDYGLRARGYRFAAYRNGREALQALLALDLQGTHPLLLLDVDLPALDGYSIFEALQRERPGAYRVVFTTVHGTEEEQLRGLEAGALDYLVKPISLRVVLEKIKRWLGK